MREQIYVIAGTLTLHVAGDTHRLSAGNSLMFDSDQPYEYRNEEERAVKFLKIVVE
jgi:quercetin dioxygenase-like cupin family protein